MSQRHRLEVVLEVLNGDNGCVGVGTNGPPYTFAATQEANVVDAFRMSLGLTTDQSVPCTQSAVPVPYRVSVAIASVTQTDSYV